MSDIKYVAGMFGKMPTERDKHFVIGRMNIKVDDCIAFLNEHQNEDGWLNVDILQRKSDPTKLNFVVDSWKPERSEDDTSATSGAPRYNKDDEQEETLPF